MTRTQAGLSSNWVRQAAAALLVVATLASGYFATRTYHAFLLLRSAYDAGSSMTSSIRPWMTLGYIAATYGTSPAALINSLGLPAEADPGTSLKSVAEQHGQAPFDYTQRVQRAIAALVPIARSDGTVEKATWPATITDAALTALLVYGYPVLALTLLLGGLGAPLPDGVATVVAGSLVAQGRMTWLSAGTIAVAASVLGDALAYMLGRWLDRGVLE
jgi:hypothetical protein